MVYEQQSAFSASLPVLEILPSRFRYGHRQVNLAALAGSSNCHRQFSPGGRYLTNQANTKTRVLPRVFVLVELAGTAPASAGLSWLVFYRYSLFKISWQYAQKQTNSVQPQFQILAHGRNSPARASRKYKTPFCYLTSRQALLPIN